MDIHLKRDKFNNITVNVDHDINRHSKNFGWGSLSEEALELSLNILHTYCDELTRERLYHKFATDIIADVPFSGTILYREDIEAWLDANIHFELNREHHEYIVAVYCEETHDNTIRFIKAQSEIEAIIHACESSFNTDTIVSLIRKYQNDYNGLMEYYQSKGIYFSDVFKMFQERNEE